MAPIMPYQFTEYLSGGLSWAFPVLVICVGFFMNWRYSGRWPLVLGWVLGFALQGVLRCLMNDLPLVVGLVPMTGVSFILFTFYMVTDPGSTPHGLAGAGCLRQRDCAGLYVPGTDSRGVRILLCFIYCLPRSRVVPAFESGEIALMSFPLRVVHWSSIQVEGGSAKER